MGLVEVTTEAVSDVSKNAEKTYIDSFGKFNFSQYLKYDRFAMLSDSELERSLTEIPQMLYSVGERISSITLERDVLKRKIKTVQNTLKSSKISAEDLSKLSTELETLQCTADVYSYMISRASSEVSAAKEYLMGVKKIWDRRREVEKSIPIAEKNYTLPEYDFSGKRYITGQDDLK